MYKKITCQICKREFNGQITGSHLKTHGSNVKEYELLYGPTRVEQLIADCRKGSKKGGGYTEGHKKKTDERIAKYYEDPILCLECNDPLNYEQRDQNKFFCSSSCAAKHNNKKRPKKSFETIRKQKLSLRKYLEEKGYYPHTKIFLNVCEICGKEYYWKAKKKTCSKECRAKLMSKIHLAKEHTGFAHSRKIEYKGRILGSPYELQFAILLDELEIEWERPSYVNYTLEDGAARKYYSDFLLENGVYIDTKNDYLQEKDRPKLKASAEQNDIIILVFGLEGINKENIGRIMISDFSMVKTKNQYMVY